MGKGCAPPLSNLLQIAHCRWLELESGLRCASDRHAKRSRNKVEVSGTSQGQCGKWMKNDFTVRTFKLTLTREIAFELSLQLKARKMQLTQNAVVIKP